MWWCCWNRYNLSHGPTPLTWPVLIQFRKMTFIYHSYVLTFCLPLLDSSHPIRDTHATGHFTPLQGHGTKNPLLFRLWWCGFSCLLVFLISKSPAAHPVMSWSHVIGACVSFPHKHVYDLWTVSAMSCLLVFLTHFVSHFCVIKQSRLT